MNVVIDSGVLISALGFGGVPLKALKVATHLGTVAFCDEMEYEVRKALLSPKLQWTPSEVDEAVRDLVDGMVRIEITGSVRGVCRDPKDDMILECAQNAGADYLISGDRDLLVLRTFGKTVILTAKSFVDLANSVDALVN